VLAFATVPLTLASVVACQSDGAPTGDPDSTLVIAIQGDPDSLDPHLSQDSNQAVVNDNVYEALVTRGADGKIAPLLATDWEAVSDTEWEFTIRPGVTFHNGEAFDAHVAAYSINRIIDPALNSRIVSLFPTITSARATDADTLVVETELPDAVLLARLVYLMMVPQEASKEPSFAEHPIGTGPYVFTSYTIGQGMTLAANEDYWGTVPEITSVELRMIPDPDTRLSALRAGEVDLVENVGPEQIPLVPQAISELSNEHIAVRLKNRGTLADPRLRQAMNYAIDKQALLDNLFAGQGEVLDAQIENPNIFGYNPDLEPYPFDPQKARELSEQAGGTGLEIELLGDGSNQWVKDREVLQAVAQQLEEVLGWTVKTNIVDWTAFVRLLSQPDKESMPEGALVYSGNEFLDADQNLTSYLTCEARLSSYCNPEVERMVEAARAELDEGKRQEMYDEILRTVAHDDPAFVYLIRSPNIFGLSERLSWQPRADGRVRVFDMSFA
jgi:peptide/nickel transport system substrate-binding protein